MRKTMFLMMMWGCVLPGAAVAADGGEKVSSTAGTAEARVFNVLKYGAVGDDKTDNTAAFSACLKALVEAGGGKMFLPDGVYRGRIVIPAVSKPLPSWITVEIAGESEPTPVFGTIGNFPLQNKGTIVNGLEFAFGHHASRFGRVGAQRCTHAVAVTGKHGFMIDQLDMEIAGKNQTDSNNVWQATAYNLNDPGNLGTGDINYWVVEGNVGAIEQFTRNRGASIQVRRIGEKR